MQGTTKCTQGKRQQVGNDADVEGRWLRLCFLLPWWPSARPSLCRCSQLLCPCCCLMRPWPVRLWAGKSHTEEGETSLWLGFIRIPALLSSNDQRVRVTSSKPQCVKPSLFIYLFILMKLSTMYVYILKSAKVINIQLGESACTM